jgi:hypothetical protein
MAGAAQPETLTLSDGTSMSFARVPGVDDSTWDEVTNYLKGNPDIAKNLQKFAKNPDAMRGWFQAQAIAEHYHNKLESKDESTSEKMKRLQEDPELKPVFDDIVLNGMPAMMKYYQDEELMLKISKKMNGLPQELMNTFKKIEDLPFSIHEAAMKGDLNALREFLSKRPVDAQDQKGITALGYAIGANHISIVKTLLDSRANPFVVDSQGNSGLHYAAGYGRKELVEFLLKNGASIGQTNAQGKTPLNVATQNKHQAVIQILNAHGATA